MQQPVPCEQCSCVSLGHVEENRQTPTPRLPLYLSTCTPLPPPSGPLRTGRSRWQRSSQYTRPQHSRPQGCGRTRPLTATMPNVAFRWLYPGRLKIKRLSTHCLPPQEGALRLPASLAEEVPWAAKERQVRPVPLFKPQRANRVSALLLILLKNLIKWW